MRQSLVICQIDSDAELLLGSRHFDFLGTGFTMRGIDHDGIIAVGNLVQNIGFCKLLAGIVCYDTAKFFVARNRAHLKIAVFIRGSFEYGFVSVGDGHGCVCQFVTGSIIPAGIQLKISVGQDFFFCGKLCSGADGIVCAGKVKAASV